MQKIRAWLKRSTESELILQWVSYFIIFAVLMIFTIGHPPEITGWRFYYTELALAILLVMNVLWFNQLPGRHIPVSEQWIFLVISAGLIFSSLWVGELFNAVYLLFMLCAQAAIMRGVWPAGLIFSTVNMALILVIFKILGQSNNDMVSLASSLVMGALFILLLAIILERYAQQTRQAERLLRELQQANAELVAARQKEKELAIAEERVRLARDIHDGLGHHLTVLSIQLQAAGKLVARNPQAAAEAIQLSRSEAQAALEEVRSSVAMMRQSPIESQPLPEALAALVRDFDQRSDLRASLEQSGDPVELSPFARQTLFRAAQEGLTNAQKHGKNVQHAWVRLRYEADAVRLSVQDDGQEPPDPGGEAGFGLLGLAERVSQLGGSLNNGPAKSGGFAVEVCLPLEPRDENQAGAKECCPP